MPCWSMNIAGKFKVGLNACWPHKALEIYKKKKHLRVSILGKMFVGVWIILIINNVFSCDDYDNADVKVGCSLRYGATTGAVNRWDFF